MSNEVNSAVSGLEGTCEEGISRRDLGRNLRKIGAALAGAGAIGLANNAGADGKPVMASPANARASKKFVGGGPGAKPAFLLPIFLRGGADGLSILAPCDDLDYQQKRTATRVWNPNDLGLPDPSMAGLPLTLGVPGRPDFYVPQVLQPLKALFDEPNSKFAFLHASGSADPSRSHFQSQCLMESGTTSMASPPVSTGCFGRHLLTKMDHLLSPELFRAFSYSSFLAKMLVGGQGVTPVPDPANYNFPIGFAATPAEEVARSNAFESMYDKFGDPLDTSMESVLKAIADINGVDFDSYNVQGGAVYPSSALGNQLKQIAQLAKEVGSLEIAQVNTGSWDTHDAQGVFASGGRMYDLLEDLALGIKAFKEDMLAGGREFIVLVMTEFGRTLQENGNAGTDHGHGGVTMVCGTNVIGGQVITTWPGLAPAQLDLGDVAVTTDIRDVIGEIAFSALKNPNTSAVVPPEMGGYQYAPVGILP